MHLFKHAFTPFSGVLAIYIAIIAPKQLPKPLESCSQRQLDRKINEHLAVMVLLLSIYSLGSRWWWKKKLILGLAMPENEQSERLMQINIVSFVATGNEESKSTRLFLFLIERSGLTKSRRPQRKLVLISLDFSKAKFGHLIQMLATPLLQIMQIVPRSSYE